MEATWMSINRRRDTEITVHVYNRVSLSYKKECICVSPNEVDEARLYYTESSTSEREKQISYPNTYRCNLKRKY